MNRDEREQLAELEALLDEALAPAPAPEGLSDRVVAATADRVDARFDFLLGEALAPDEAPQGMDDRILERVMAMHQMRHPRPLARIGGAMRSLSESWRVAAAVLIVVGYGAAMLLSLYPTAEPRPIARTDETAVTFAAAGRQLESLRPFMKVETTYFDEGDQEVQVLAMDIDMSLTQSINDGLFTPDESEMKYDGGDDWMLSYGLPYELLF